MLGTRPIQRSRAATAVAAIAVLLGTTLVGCSPTPAPPSSRCSTDALVLTCPHNSTTLVAAGEARVVHWQVPRGTPPTGGWPVAIMFQGTLATAALSWTASPLEPFGAYYQTQVVQGLLDNGFAVLTPETHLAGLTFWDTNNPLVPDYYQSNDHALMLTIFDRLADGTFGAVNPARLFATGISSGGYMTSRMAVSYPGRFKALAIQSASYATCAGPLCSIGPIPTDHPPTLFLHGNLDPVVPVGTMWAYAGALNAAGRPTRVVVDPLSLHRWIPQAPGEVVNWFRTYNS